VNGGNILLVDDEPQLLSLLQRYLTRMGFVVQTCGGGNVAIKIFDADSGGYDLIVADLGLADVPGDRLLIHLLSQSDQVRGLLCSGSPYEISQFPADIQARVGFLQKPFTPQMLARSIEQLA
jgi:DNA-binding response OmpR family regulator